MAAYIVTAIYQRTQTTSAECTILRVIGQVANVQGRNARIAYEAIAQRAGYTTRWVIELVSRLEERGILHVQRVRRRYALHDVNTYHITRPWLKDLTYREALDQRKAAQQQRTPAATPRKASSTESRSSFPSERCVHPEETKERKRAFPSFVDGETLTRKLGLTPGSRAYRLALGLEDPPETLTTASEAAQ